MGIKNLLKLVKCKPKHISSIAGSTVAIDMSCLIYKGLYRGDVVKYVQIYINRLTQLNCHIYLVFDGKPPNMKLIELARRRSPYSANKTEAVGKLQNHFSKYQNVCIIQSPQEADPQLAYLVLNGYADYVVTDDSDLIVYGCERIIFKLNPRGYFMMYNRKDLCNFVDLDLTTFRWMCILAGCDYLPGGYKGMGLIKAKKWVLEHKLADDCKTLENFLKQLPCVNEDFIAM